VWARASTNVPTGVYTGNAKDEILLPSDHAYSDWQDPEATLHERGVPYFVGSSNSAGDLRVDGGQGKLAKLTIEPGVTMKFKKGGVLRITVASGTNAPTGVLVAAGTAAKPIVFTSGEDAPVAGSWLGLTFGEVPSPNNKIDHARIEFAGGATVSGSDSCIMPSTTINDAAVRVLGEAPQFITNTVISDSASNGIDRGFRSDLKPTFLPTNTFVNVLKCTETYPKDANGACPSSVPCPR
jgi:hypothetical protein